MNSIIEIERKRSELKVPLESLCHYAGVGRTTYYRCLKGYHAARPTTVRRLSQTLTRIMQGFYDQQARSANVRIYSNALHIAANELGIDIDRLVASDPSRRATGDKEWLACARGRRLAWALLNSWGINVSSIARLTGGAVTKQAVSQGIEAIGREPALEAIIAKYERIVG